MSEMMIFRQLRSQRLRRTAVASVMLKSPDVRDLDAWVEHGSHPAVFSLMQRKSAIALASEQDFNDPHYQLFEREHRKAQGQKWHRRGRS